MLGAAVAAWLAAVLRLQEDTGDPTFFQQFWGGFNPSMAFHPLPDAGDGSGNLLFLWLNFPSNVVQVWLATLTGATPARQVTIARVLAAIGVGIAAPLLFRLARRRGLGDGPSLALAAAFVLNPFLLSAANELMIGYGLAVAAGLFLAAETGRRRLALALAVLHCGIHPTAFLMVAAWAWFVLPRGDALRRPMLVLCGTWVAWLAVVNFALLATGTGTQVLRSHLGLLAGIWEWARGGLDGMLLLQLEATFAAQVLVLLASAAFLPVLGGRWLWVLLPDFAYMLLREGSVYRGTFAAVTAVLFVAAADGLARRAASRPAAARRVPAAAAAALAASMVVSVAVGEVQALWISRPVLATFGIPWLTSRPNATLAALREEAAGPDAPACITAEMDLAPALMGMRSQVRVFGVDPLDPACDRVVLRTEAPHRAFLPERVAGNVGSKHPADYEAARQALEASPDFRRVRDVDGLTIWESVRPATPATRPRAGSGNPDGRGARLLAG